MKPSAITFLTSALVLIPALSPLYSSAQRFRHVEPKKTVSMPRVEADPEVQPDTIDIIPRSVEEILESITVDPSAPDMNLFGMPKIFMGYRKIEPPKAYELKDSLLSNALFHKIYHQQVPDTIERVVYTVVKEEENPWDLAELPDMPETTRDSIIIREAVMPEPMSYIITGEVVPEWLSRGKDSFRRQMDMQYMNMIYTPAQENYAYWTLPVPPTLPPDDYSYAGFLRRQNIVVNTNSAVVSEVEIEKKHWLHVVNFGVQFSQAYLSKNWYQGGNDYLSLVGNFFWDVQLNPVYHPNLMFQSTLSYKLGVNSTDNEETHQQYSISVDEFQHNLKFGYRAAHNWYYSVTTQFKTQLLNYYPINSSTRTASFLTPGNLNVGVGMTYSKQNAKKTMTFNASISPLSYNLKTAIDPKVNHGQFGMEQDEKTLSEYGSSAELTFNWDLLSNIHYRTRLFLFTDYRDNSNADWQNTFEFQFSRFFSTQLYINLRYDSTADKEKAPKWNRWMMKELLSVGLSYTFSTKQ